MLSLRRIFNIFEVRIFSYLSLMIISVIAFFYFVNFIFIQPLVIDVENAKRGLSRNEVEFSKINREVSLIQQTIDEKSKGSKGVYEHYYALYTNPVRYINQFVLSKAKPGGLLITSSSVVPNTIFTSRDRSKFKPFLKVYGVSNFKDLQKLFSVVNVSISARGSFPIIGTYLTNLNNLPLSFSMYDFELKENNSMLELNLKLSFFVHNLELEN